MARRDAAPPMPGGSLGDLLKARGLAPSAAPSEAPTPSPTPTPEAVDLDTLPKVVLRVQRKGHGGKTVTRVEGLTLPDAVLHDRCKQLKKSLGTGVRVDGDALVVQGEQLDRVRAWLTAQGVRRVVS